MISHDARFEKGGRVSEIMKVQDLREQFDQLQELKPADIRRNPDLRLEGVQNIMSSLHNLEELAAKEWGAVSLTELKDLYAFLPKVEASLSRLEAGKKRRLESEEAA